MGYRWKKKCLDSQVIFIKYDKEIYNSNKKKITARTVGRQYYIYKIYTHLWNDKRHSLISITPRHGSTVMAIPDVYIHSHRSPTIQDEGLCSLKRWGIFWRLICPKQVYPFLLTKLPLRRQHGNRLAPCTFTTAMYLYYTYSKYGKYTIETL